MTRADVIAWTYEGAAYCADHKPAQPAHPLGDLPSPVFRHEAAAWEDGGLTCDRCDIELVADDTCRQCDRSLRDDHDAYTFGPADHPRTAVDICRPHTAYSVLVRDAGRTWADIVGTAGTVVDALDILAAAYAHAVVTFDVVESETVAA